MQPERVTLDRRGRIRAFAASTRGIAAVEFAFVLPIMLIAYFGLVEVATLVDMDRKTTLLSRALADLTGRATSMDQTQMNAIFAAASAVMAPYAAGGAKLVVTNISVADQNGTPTGTVEWSCGKNETKRTQAQNPVPAGFTTAGSSYILAEVKVDYTPMFGYVLKSGKTLSQTTPWPVRIGNQVSWSGAAC